jgi:hypothetical protein
MRPALLLMAALCVGCGAEIGDACIVSTDCAPDGSRACDLNSAGGYCTIAGCDYNTCPGEAECVRFFTGSFSNRTCTASTEDCIDIDNACTPDKNNNPVDSPNCTCPFDSTTKQYLASTNDCNVDELCALDGHCVTRASELRFCMRKCDSQGGCRDGYECRDRALMIKDGGEPVPAPGKRLDENNLTKFCAQSPPVGSGSGSDGS